jgi:hypothetical protein
MKKEASPLPKHQALKWNVIEEAESTFLKAELVSKLGLKRLQGNLVSVHMFMKILIQHESYASRYIYIYL